MNIFRKPIGTLQSLGKPSEWLFDLAGMLVCAIVLILFLVVL